MAIIITNKGHDVPYLVWLELKLGWCPYCHPSESDIKITGRYTAKCANCETTFIYTSK